MAGFASLALMLSGALLARADEEPPAPDDAAVAVEPAAPAVEDTTPAESPEAAEATESAAAPEPAAPEPTEAPPPTEPAAEEPVVEEPVVEEPVVEEPVVEEPVVEAIVEEAVVPSAMMVVGGFEIDGNWVVDTAGNLDWANVGYSVHDDGFNDTTQIGGKENDPAGWYQEGPNATGKADIGRVWSYSNVVGGDQYLHLGLHRSAGNGSVAYVVELNQSPDVVGLVPVRTVGDLRLNIQQGGNGPFALLGVELWNG